MYSHALGAHELKALACTHTHKFYAHTNVYVVCVCVCIKINDCEVVG